MAKNSSSDTCLSPSSSKICGIPLSAHTTRIPLQSLSAHLESYCSPLFESTRVELGEHFHKLKPRCSVLCICRCGVQHLHFVDVLASFFLHPFEHDSGQLLVLNACGRVNDSPGGRIGKYQWLRRTLFRPSYHLSRRLYRTAF